MNGAERITKERDRQIEKEGWTADHDDGHINNEIARAAACYAAEAGNMYIEEVMVIGPDMTEGTDPWPWDDKWDKRVDDPTIDNKIRMLEKAGALCAAEIDRLLRLKSKES